MLSYIVTNTPPLNLIKIYLFFMMCLHVRIMSTNTNLNKNLVEHVLRLALSYEQSPLSLQVASKKEIYE